MSQIRPCQKLRTNIESSASEKIGNLLGRENRTTAAINDQTQGFCRVLSTFLLEGTWSANLEHLEQESKDNLVAEVIRMRAVNVAIMGYPSKTPLFDPG
ncbi:uncharacterized protein [Bemisia tabaci]|uniref:uncharacterized protein isoform X2 n=1 Tax=Bemisia tabaci TaxID=7038 RepID=UPI003B28687E